MKLILIIFGLFLSTSLFAKTAQDVALDMNIASVDFVRPFDASSDPNEQLGRPNQYIEKVSWPDKRIDPKFESDGYYDSEIDPTEYKGGTIEKFKNINDLNRRYNYIKNIHLNAPYLNEYMYKKGLYLMRLNKAFTPNQAKEYEIQFNKVIK